METERYERPFVKLSGTHAKATTCQAQTTWVYIWKDEAYWAGRN